MALDLENLTLMRGAHVKRDDGLCLMEAVALFAGEKHSDHPPCTSRVLADFGIRLNDRMNETERQRLKPFIPRLIGTNDGKDLVRANILAWAAITEFAPAALRTRKIETLDIFAERLEGLPRYDWANAQKIAREAAADASAADARAKIFDLALAAFGRAIRLEEPA